MVHFSLAKRCFRPLSHLSGYFSSSLLFSSRESLGFAGSCDPPRATPPILFNRGDACRSLAVRAVFVKPPPRPKKPYAEFPLAPHTSGKWMKKIRGHIHYFDAWATRVDSDLVRVPGDGAKGAEEEYNAVRDDLHAGRTSRVKRDELTVADLCNHFRTAKLRVPTAG